MHWKALILKYEGDSNNIVGIVIYKNKKKTQVIYILGKLKELGLKNKWKNPMKIKKWLLYNYHSNSYASLHLRAFFLGKSFNTTYLDGFWELGYFDKSIIEKKFPGMAGIAFPKEKKKSGKKRK